MPSVRKVVTVLSCCSVLAACGADPGQQASPAASSGPQPVASNEGAESTDACATRVLEALASRSGEALADVAHPERGIRFTAYGFVKPEGDVVLERAALTKAFSDPTKRSWGYQGESDERIQLTPAEFFQLYLSSPDGKPWERATGTAPASYEAAAFNVTTLQRDLKAAYPIGEVVELRRPPKMPDSFSWRVVRVVCEVHEGKSYAVGLVHNAWSP